MNAVLASLLNCNEYHCINRSTDCETGSYGKNCEETCGYCKDRRPCDIVNGNCTNGCEAWYTSNICKTFIRKWNTNIFFFVADDTCKRSTVCKIIIMSLGIMSACICFSTVCNAKDV